MCAQVAVAKSNNARIQLSTRGHLILASKAANQIDGMRYQPACKALIKQILTYKEEQSSSIFAIRQMPVENYSSTPYHDCGALHEQPHQPNPDKLQDHSCTLQACLAIYILVLQSYDNDLAKHLWIYFPQSKSSSSTPPKPQIASAQDS